MIVNKYGGKPYKAVVIHGGPGAAGEVKPVAQRLALTCGVIEPYQTKFSVDEQAEELLEQINKYCDTPVTLIGFSYGAWLAFIFSARYPGIVKKLILVSSGSFDEIHNINMLDKRLSRLTVTEAEEARKLLEIISDTENKDIENGFKRFGSLLSKADTYGEMPGIAEAEIVFRADIHQSVWNDAKELRRTGKLLEFGKHIKCPVTAIHGDYDPHPADGVEEPLKEILPDFKFILLEKCGHTPWREKYAGEKFFEILNEELKV